ncbi:MAG: hypothetical protein P8N76_23870, partial [Pirellulaceae bacterium]|nr:hypothetical protein [Pirellulaceae bacterium]
GPASGLFIAGKTRPTGMIPLITQFKKFAVCATAMHKLAMDLVAIQSNDSRRPFRLCPETIFSRYNTHC